VRKPKHIVLIQDGDPAVVLLDPKPTKIDGLEVLRQMETDVKLECLPMVIINASRRTCDRDEDI
jgi:CheY-like chemotaxis protein